MDIDDILASVDRGPGASPESAALDHQQLTRFWVAERAVSEVLPWPAPLMERVMDRVRIQVGYTTIPQLQRCHYSVLLYAYFQSSGIFGSIANTPS